MKKIIMFSREKDIDGMGCVFLGNIAFKDDLYVYVPCKSYDINTRFLEYYDNDDLDKYDLIFLTDLCLDESLLTRISKDKTLAKKIHILHHQRTDINFDLSSYTFVNIVEENNGFLECATSLFYKYLVAFKYINRDKFLDDFVTLTREYDTWEWVNNNTTRARELNILCESLTIEEYLRALNNLYKPDSIVTFDEYTSNIIKIYEKNLVKSLKQARDTIRTTTIEVKDNSYKIGFIDCKYNLRNDLPQYLIDNNEPIAVLGMIITDEDIISYRAIKPGVNCSLIARKFGGKGSFEAGSNPKDNKAFKEFYKLAFNKEIDKNDN